MPIYAYRCEACGFAKDVLQKVSDPQLTVCLSCGEPTFKKQLTAAGFQLKGTGWYATDFRNGSGTAAPAAAGNGPEAGGEVKTGSENSGSEKAVGDGGGSEKSASTGTAGSAGSDKGVADKPAPAAGSASKPAVPATGTGSAT